jgi:hypothetical protein
MCSTKLNLIHPRQFRGPFAFTQTDQNRKGSHSQMCMTRANLSNSHSGTYSALRYDAVHVEIA